MGTELTLLMPTCGDMECEYESLHAPTMIQVNQNRELFGFMYPRLIDKGKEVEEKITWCGQYIGTTTDAYGAPFRYYSANLIGKLFEEYQPSPERRPKERELEALAMFLQMLPETYCVILYWH